MPVANHEGDVKYRNFRNFHRPLINSDSSGYSNSQMTSQTRNIYEGDHPDAAIYAPALGVNYRRRLRKESFGSGRSSPSSSLESTRSNSSSSLASSMMTLTSVDSR